MTKPKPKPKYVIDAPLPDYFAPGNAVRGAIGLIPKENRTSITIDTDKYNEVAWELVDESQKRYAGPNTVIDECTQINKVAWELINLLNNASTTTINAIDKREIDYGIPGNDKTFNLGDAHFSVIGIIQATEKAKASIESG
jgi:hypothetical protein